MCRIGIGRGGAKPPRCHGARARGNGGHRRAGLGRHPIGHHRTVGQPCSVDPGAVNGSGAREVVDQRPYKADVVDRFFLSVAATAPRVPRQQAVPEAARPGGVDGDKPLLIRQVVHAGIALMAQGLSTSAMEVDDERQRLPISGLGWQVHIVDPVAASVLELPPLRTDGLASAGWQRRGGECNQEKSDPRARSGHEGPDRKSGV